MESWEIDDARGRPSITRGARLRRRGTGDRAPAPRRRATQRAPGPRARLAAWSSPGAVEISEPGGETVTGGPGLLAVFDPNERHEVAATEDARLLLVLSPWPGEGHPLPGRLGLTGPQASGTSTRSASPISRSTRRRDAAGDHARGEVVDHDGARADDRVGADLDPWTDDRAGPEPDVVGDDDRRRALPARPAWLRVDRVGRGQQLDPGRELAAAADRDRRGVEQDAVEVDEGPVADRDPAAVVAAKRLLDDHALAYLPEQLGEDRVEPVLVGGRRRVVALDQMHGALVLAAELGIGAVELAAQQPPLRLAHLSHRPQAGAGPRSKPG